MFISYASKTIHPDLQFSYKDLEKSIVPYHSTMLMKEERDPSVPAKSLGNLSLKMMKSESVRCGILPQKTRGPFIRMFRRGISPKSLPLKALQKAVTCLLMLVVCFV